MAGVNSRASKDLAMTLVGGARFVRNKVLGTARKVTNKVKSMVKNRIQVQKNFQDRRNNKNYYGSIKDFK